MEKRILRKARQFKLSKTTSYPLQPVFSDSSLTTECFEFEQHYTGPPEVVNQYLNRTIVVDGLELLPRFIWIGRTSFERETKHWTV